MTLSAEFVFDPADAELRADPYPTYRHTDPTCNCGDWGDCPSASEPSGIDEYCLEYAHP